MAIKARSIIDLVSEPVRARAVPDACRLAGRRAAELLAATVDVPPTAVDAAGVAVWMLAATTAAGPESDASITAGGVIGGGVTTGEVSVRGTSTGDVSTGGVTTGGTSTGGMT